MFRSDWVERYFSRVRPWHVLALWVPIVTLAAAAGLRGGLAPWPLAAWALGGVLVWTLVEYLLHRFVFHFTPRGPSQEALSFLIHGIHHDYPHDADRLVMPPAVSLLIGAILLGAAVAIAGQPQGFGLFAGIAIGYLWYDLTHYAIHHLRPRTRLGKALRRYHLIHHFKEPTRRYGVSTPLWDLVFGTHPSWQPARRRHPSIAARTSGAGLRR